MTVIDDEEDYLLTRELLSEIEGEQFVLEHAASYPDGLAAMQSAAPDICLVDYRLGHQSGLDLLRAAQAQGRSVPVIFLTGQGDRDIDLAAMQAGAADYLVKSQMSAALLARSIRYALERQRTVEALRQREEHFRALVQHASDIIAVIDVDGIVSYVSPAVERVLGRPRAELEGTNFVSDTSNGGTGDGPGTTTRR